MLKCLLITRKSKFNDTDRIEVECQVILVNVLMPCDAFKERLRDTSKVFPLSMHNVWIHVSEICVPRLNRLRESE